MEIVLANLLVLLTRFQYLREQAHIFDGIHTCIQLSFLVATSIFLRVMNIEEPFILKIL